ncbi:uncharacterized protein A1O5_11234 [Cladophialophora psammophila CBS 110553]|uniref:GST N-terminal domain-containing protein n=1 Tax=Cladophialophora psammophila CBS 110553 TaxID=1182543 RepID=W9WC75_9EURO|nr:uncharacterized protein A1O5_11234 [Cladophialophora psammophila CBS 110553]EXJ65707.1 hypothetical protein A1O5_11234 [Cladophialophora psammophila CBS 110553]
MAEEYTLFYNDYSICSIMVRYTVAVIQHLQDGRIRINEQPIDIQHGGQLAESYLCKVNPKGTVPVLTSSNPQRLKTPLSESVDITYFLAEYFPTLCPPHLASQITSLLSELHDINYFSLTYTDKPHRAVDMENSVQKVLARSDISERYRKALELKLEVIRATRAPALTTEAVVVQKQKALSFLSKIEALLGATETNTKGSDHGGFLWIFGTPEATALDAHVVPLIARLLDVGRGAMFEGNPRVRAYADRAFETEAWKDVMQRRRTVYGTYL